MDNDIEKIENLIDELESFIDEQENKDSGLEETIKEDKREIIINSLDQANYLIKKVKEIRDEKEQIITAAEAEIEKQLARINTWRDSKISPLEFRENMFLAALERFFTEYYNGVEEDKRKPIKLSYGSISYRKQQDEYEYDDNTILQFLKENNLSDFIKIKEEPKRGEFKKTLEVKDNTPYYNDKQVPGIKIIPRNPTFTIK